MAIQNTLVDTLAANVLFFASTGTEQAITTMIFCNTSNGNDANLDLWVVPFGSIPGTSLNQVLRQVSIPRTETFVMDTEKLILSSQDTIYGLVTYSGIPAPVVNACISSVQV
jgi:hypothetical protein